MIRTTKDSARSEVIIHRDVEIEIDGKYIVTEKYENDVLDICS